MPFGAHPDLPLRPARQLAKLADLADLSSCSELFLDRRLVTASALLDLVSAAWVESLASECRVAGAAGLFALIYDGRIHCSPEEPGDDAGEDPLARFDAELALIGGTLRQLVTTLRRTLDG